MNVVVLVAPPQTAKTAPVGHHVFDFPGAVFTTSTRADVYAHTGTSAAGRPAGVLSVLGPVEAKHGVERG